MSLVSRTCACMLVLVLSVFSMAVAAATWDVVYPRPLSDKDKRNAYPIAVLRLALQQTGINYTLHHSLNPLSQGRAIASLQAHRDINVLWSMTDSNREKQLLPIRIPIYKGLIGLRLLLVKSDTVKNLTMVNSLAALRAFTMVQGKDWPDTKILQANGFDVQTSPGYGGLFELLNQRQAELFPRSVVEIWQEQVDHQGNDDLTVAPKLALYYPTAMYFFVNKKNHVLANVIRTGLQRAIANGKFEKLFLQVHQPLLKKADLAHRRVFILTNPVLPSGTPLTDKALWYPVGQ